MYVSRTIAFSLVGVAAVAAVAVIFSSLGQQPAGEVPLPVAKPATPSRSGILQLPPRVEPTQKIGGTVVAVGDSSIRISTLRLPPDPEHAGVKEEREVRIDGATNISQLTPTADRKLKRVPATLGDIRAQDNVNVETSADFAKSGIVVASRVDIFPRSGPLFLPIE